MAILVSRVNTSAPTPATPTQIISSGTDGVYSYNSPSIPGVKPGSTRPIPFSMKTPKKTRTQPRFMVSMRFRVLGIMSSRKATTLQVAPVQAQRARPMCSPTPSK